ncbi:GntR family transcriptional regulator [Phaeobacter sp. B1627]|uniref:GntR family transcriptional regulator n=1 Tax=Phaeobacter sp. B1627 TaxID=2583809 RepID=UPI00159EE591|nr:GntR family transcriptional regulator [Phaeobacter sp. B1627]
MSKRAKVVSLPRKYVQKIDPYRPAAEQIASSIKLAVLEMSLKPGQIISETEIGNVYGASRTPVREAFTWLRDQGLIVTYPSRGNFVSRLSIPQIKGAQFARESLEVSIAELLCDEGLSGETVHEIEANLASQDEMLKSGNGTAFRTLDDNFHLALADAVGHPRICDIIQKEKAYLDRLRVLSLTSMDHIAELVKDHRNIFDAIQSGDKPAARQHVRLHLRRVLSTLSELFEAHREYFDDY